MDTCYSGWSNIKKIYVQTCILGSRCILYFFALCLGKKQSVKI